MNKTIISLEFDQPPRTAPVNALADSSSPACNLTNAAHHGGTTGEYHYGLPLLDNCLHFQKASLASNLKTAVQDATD